MKSSYIGFRNQKDLQQIVVQNAFHSEIEVVKPPPCSKHIFCKENVCMVDVAATQEESLPLPLPVD
jgi:hypothetical protein